MRILASLMMILVIFVCMSYSENEKMTLDKAISIAVQQNLDLKMVKQKLYSSEYDEKAAISEGFLPQVDFVNLYTRIDSNSFKRANQSLDFMKQIMPSGSDVDIEPFAYKETYSSKISVSQPIFNGASIGSYRMMKSMRKETQATLDELKLDIIFSVKNFYYNILATINTVEILKQKVDATKEHLRSIERMVEHGVASRSDLVRWKLQLAKDEGDLTSANIADETLRKRFNNLLNLPLDSVYEFEEAELGDFIKNFKDNINSEKNYESDDNHPTLLKKKYAQETLKASRFMALSSFFPNVNLSFNYGWHDDNDIALDDYTKWNVGVMLNIPLFHSGKNYFKLKSADNLFRLSVVDYEKTRNELNLANYVAELKLEEQYSQIEISEHRIEDAEENMKVIKNKYEVGVASNLDFIDATVELTAAKLDNINAKYNFLIAIAEKEKVRGKLTP
jgi:outer membrane protein